MLIVYNTIEQQFQQTVDKYMRRKTDTPFYSLSATFNAPKTRLPNIVVRIGRCYCLNRVVSPLIKGTDAADYENEGFISMVEGLSSKC